MTAVLDGGWRTTREAEHATRAALDLLELRPSLACTHFVDGRVVVTLDADPGVALPDQVDEEVLSAGGGVADAVGFHRARTAGRVFVFDGDASLPERLPVRDFLARTAVEDVRGIGFAVDPGTDLITQHFVRPALLDGRMVLQVRPVAGDAVVPFEQPNPTPCCADH